MAQFIDPVTPDIAASCLSASVRNTGTSAFGDLQAVVVDGSDPSIIFIDYSTVPPTEFCFPIQAFAQGASVTDPDVVWDYSGSGLLLVVYESNLGPTGIWSEMWDWNGGSPRPVGGYGAGGFFNFSTGATCPNVDADVVGNAVVVWERAGDIEAMTVDFPTLTPSGNTCLVNVGGCGMNRSIEPDVAIRYFNGNSFVDFVMVDQGTPSGDIKTVFEKFTNVQGGAVTCIIHTVQHAGGLVPTRVAKPRIDMPTYWNSLGINYRNEFACSVLYELYDGTNSHIASSQLQDVAGPSFPVAFPPPSNVVFEQTYSPPSNTNYEWISEILNTAINPIITPAPFPFNQQLVPPIRDLETYPNSGPVTTFAGDRITYLAWNWVNTGLPGRPSNSPEVISRRLMYDLDGNTTTLFSPPFDTEFRHVIPVPTTSRYLAIGEGYLNSEPQTLISVDGDFDWVSYAFTAPQSGRIYYKRSFQNSTAPVRIARPEVHAEAVINENVAFNVYPNPTSGPVEIQAEIPIKQVVILSLDGKVLKNFFLEGNKTTIDIDLSFLNAGVYPISVTSVNGNTDFVKIVITK